MSEQMRTASERRGLSLLALASALAACSGAPARPAGATYRPPPPLALVAIVDPSPGQAAAELRQLAAVIQSAAAPAQTLVVSLLATAPPAHTHVVRGGESLSSIAGAEGVSLAALQAANPQLGPLAQRDWNRVYPGDRVTVPDGAPDRPAIVTRAPAGPPPPALVAAPARPANATTFQEAQYRHALAAAAETNRQRISAWQSAAALAVAPWQAQVLRQLDELGRGGAAAPADPADGRQVTAAVEAAANTLAGLPGRRVLLLLAGGPAATAAAPAAGTSLAHVHLVVANAPAGTPLTAAATAAGATVTVLDPALTELQLPAVVGG